MQSNICLDPFVCYEIATYMYVAIKQRPLAPQSLHCKMYLQLAVHQLSD